MKFIILLACVIAGTLTVDGTSNDVMTNMGLSEEDIKQCYQDSGFSPDDAEKWEDMKEEDLTQENVQKFACFVHCLNEKSGVTVNSIVEVEKMTEVIKKFKNGTSEDEIRGKIEICDKQERNLNDPCSSALQLMMCFQESFKDSQ